MIKEQKLHLSTIKDGTVIDHIQSSMLFKVLSLLNIKEGNEEEVLIGYNLQSKKRKEKGLIKLTNRFLKKEEINKIAILTKGSKISTIKNYKIEEKIEVRMPREVLGIIKCHNPNCITNNESVITKFHIIEPKEPIIQCFHCEKIFKKEHILFN